MNEIFCCNALEGLQKLPSNSVHCAVTSPPYFSLRSYLPNNHPDKILEIGTEKNPFQYIENLVVIFRELRRVLRPDGTFWLNIGDSRANYKDQGVRFQTIAGKSRGEPAHGFASNRDGKLLKQCGFKDKDAMLIPFRLAISLQEDGWTVRQDIIWNANNRLPESVKDRFTKSHEYVFLLTKNKNYYFDQQFEPLSLEAKRRAMRGNSSKNKYAAGIHLPSKVHAHTMSQPRPYRGYEFMEEIIAAGETSLDPRGRNMRSVWNINTKPFKGAHFATFPPALVERCIKAGTSEKGCCENCGAPYKRIIKKGKPNEAWKKLCGADSRGEYLGKATKNYEQAKAQNASATKARILKGMREKITTGWEKTCKCETKEIIPCVVLDCFMGAHTTAVVAKELGRNYIGFELNPEYCKIGEKRLNQVQMELRI